ncbi:hypothetical protein CBR_g22282 [Chara braunii]|uniref:Integrase catalytic domain-containing protein n=1 Tax=Chara braunii TaxID=69332 RepID=A0A388L2I3_CHABU|nr:hypothetical protein CBR_g22282 [Chara braunii]|eukprot:GBG76534.1 hypothetical protein CBR_g22282 [Chara braunii]
MADGGGKCVTLDELIDALDKRERAPSNVPKVDTFHFKGDWVSDWLDLIEQALVALADEVRFQRIMRYVLHSHHQEVGRVVDAANGSWARFRDMMLRKYRLGDGLLTMADLEAMNKDDFSTIGAFVHEFKKKARKVHGISEEAQCATFLGLLTGSEAAELTKHGEGSEKLTWTTIDKGVEEGSSDQVEQHQMRLQRRKRKERDATASGTPGVKRIVTDVLAALGYDNEAEIQKRGVTVAQGRASGAVDEEAGREDYGGGETGFQALTKAQKKQRNLLLGGQGSGKGQAPQAIAAQPPVAAATPAPAGPKEVVEVQEEEEEVDDKEDERLRQEEDRRAEQRAKKRGIQGEAETGLHDGVPKRKKYAVRLEGGFDVERMVDKLLEGHNDLMNMKDILASAPRLRGELKGRLSRSTASNVMVGIGRVRARTCFFVMPDVDHPILLGRSFLRRTETLVFNRHEGTMILTLSDPACGNYEIIKCRNTGPESGRNRLNLTSFTFEESEYARRRLREEQEEEGAAGVLSLSLNDVNKAMDVVATHDMADPEATKALTEQGPKEKEEDEAMPGLRRFVWKHVQDIDQILSLLEEHNLTASGPKSKNCMREATILGFVCNEKGQRPNVKKTDKILEWPAPFHSITDVRSFLGTGGFWRSFVKDFAAKMEHLRKLVRQDQEWVWDEDQEWVWDEDQEKAMDRMKAEFKEGGLVLGAPNYEATEEKPFIVETDAGPTALGGVLIQADVEGKERPLKFESRTLNTTERNYSQFKKETLAVLHCLRTFRNYIFGRRLILRVDPTALVCSLKSYTSSDPTIARWLPYIWMFNFELGRIPEDKNKADGLSRINWEGVDQESVEDTPPVDGFLDQEEDVRLHINEWSLRVPSCVTHPIWLALRGYERKEELVLKPFQEEDPWGSKDVGWMMKLALAGTHSLAEEDDEFEEGEIREAFRTEEYDGIYRELGLFLSCEIRDRDASAKAHKMSHLYVVRDDHLFIKRQVGNPKRIVCGRNRQIDVIAALHDGIAGGQRGISAMCAKISELYHWDGMLTMVIKYCQSCVPCQEGSAQRSGEPLHPRLEREVGAVVHLNLLFMPAGENGCNYIFDARDNLTGFVDGRAIRMKTVPVLANCIEEYYLRYPFVKEFVMDRGSEFTCNEVRTLLAGYGVMANYTTATHPQGNAHVERRHSTITNLLAKWTEGRPAQWPKFLRAAFFVENVTIKMTTKSDFSKAAMQRGGRDARSRQGSQRASGKGEQHGPPRREPMPEFDDDNIELFLDVCRDHAAQRGWSVVERIHHLRGIGRFEEPVAQICEEALTWPDVEAGMQRLRVSPRGRDGMPIRLEEGNAKEFIPAYEHYMLIEFRRITSEELRPPSLSPSGHEPDIPWETPFRSLATHLDVSRWEASRLGEGSTEPARYVPLEEPLDLGTETDMRDRGGPHDPEMEAERPDPEAEMEDQGACEGARVEVLPDLPSATHAIESSVTRGPAPGGLPPALPRTGEGIGTMASTPEGREPRVERASKETREEKTARVRVRLAEIHARQAEMEAAGIEPMPPVEPKTSEQRIDDDELAAGKWGVEHLTTQLAEERARSQAREVEWERRFGEMAAIVDRLSAAWEASQTGRAGADGQGRGIQASPSRGAAVEAPPQAGPMGEVPLDSVEEEGGAQESLMAMSTESRGSRLHELAATMGTGTPQERRQRLDTPDYAPRLGELRTELGS